MFLHAESGIMDLSVECLLKLSNVVWFLDLQLDELILVVSDSALFLSSGEL